LEKNIKLVLTLTTIGIILIILGLIVAIYDANKEAYCNSLEFREYYENKECRRFMK
jgi:uncharacterized membrane protein